MSEKKHKSRPKTQSKPEQTSSKKKRPETTETKPDSKEKKKDDPVVQTLTTTIRGETILTPDPKNHTIKHPLQSGWTMWYNGPPTKKDREGDSWKPESIISFASVEDFWCLHTHLRPPSELDNGSNYHLFKEGVNPEWEDEANKRGGKWIITFGGKDLVDDAWLNLVLALIGEGLDADEISGGVVSPRAKQTKLALWVKEASKETILRIGKALKENLGLRTPIGYQLHADALTHKVSYKNTDFYTV